MLILNRMIVKKLLKKIALSVILLSFCTLRANGAEPGFSIYPNGGQVVKPQEGFIVDIEIDSGGRAIVNAKFTLLFDPAVLQLVKAERNNTLFQAWPEDESTLKRNRLFLAFIRIHSVRRQIGRASCRERV